MPRPKKRDDAKLHNRITVYLTEAELNQLRTVATHTEQTQTQIMREALQMYLERLTYPVEVKIAKHDEIMRRNDAMLRGYLCANVHPYWILWSNATEPRFCPVCGSQREHRRTWDGLMRRGV
ncbi:MAG: ribbon-helix-helix protein, CopG family [Alicyclobacillus mali]|nr:ribbon-helix-helix protein, CopG family [Alicyclobacillus mali (ex Roth et al. 2021)]